VLLLLFFKVFNFKNIFKKNYFLKIIFYIDVSNDLKISKKYYFEIKKFQIFLKIFLQHKNKHDAKKFGRFILISGMRLPLIHKLSIHPFILGCTNMFSHLTH
jgi:hypothetical protein